MAAVGMVVLVLILVTLGLAMVLLGRTWSVSGPEPHVEPVGAPALRPGAADRFAAADVIDERDLDSLRGDPEFEAIVAEVRSRLEEEE